MARRKKTDESANGETQEAAAPGVGHNQLTDDQRAALTFHHKRKYEAALALKKKAEADFKNACKVAKSELGDDAVADIKDMIALDTEEGEARLKAEAARIAKVARWMGMPVGSEPDMFSTDRTPAVDRAFALGRKAGLAGENCSPPHSPETEQHKRWMEGFHEGQAVLAKGIKPLTPREGASAKIAAETVRADEEALAVH